MEIPIIAANLQRLILARQSQVWAVLQAKDSLPRIRYSLAATFLGRMCISGNLHELEDAVLAELQKAQALYVQVSPVIADGKTRIFRNLSPSWRRPKGWQAVVREGRGAADGQVLVVLHTFANAPSEIEFPLPPGQWTLGPSFGLSGESMIAKGRAVLSGISDFQGGVFLLQR